MNQLNSNTQHQKGKHLSFEERVIIQTRLKDNYSPNKIAAELGCSILFGRRVFLCPHYFHKIFSQKYYIFSSFVNSFLSAPFSKEIFAACCTFLFFNRQPQKQKPPKQDKPASRGIHVKLYFAFGPNPYFFR